MSSSLSLPTTCPRPERSCTEYAPVGRAATTVTTRLLESPGVGSRLHTAPTGNPFVGNGSVGAGLGCAPSAAAFAGGSGAAFAGGGAAAAGAAAALCCCCCCRRAFAASFASLEAALAAAAACFSAALACFSAAFAAFPTSFIERRGATTPSTDPATAPSNSKRSHRVPRDSCLLPLASSRAPKRSISASVAGATFCSMCTGSNTSAGWSGWSIIACHVWKDCVPNICWSSVREAAVVACTKTLATRRQRVPAEVVATDWPMTSSPRSPRASAATDTLCLRTLSALGMSRPAMTR